jgi:hypothetical protein
MKMPVEGFWDKEQGLHLKKCFFSVLIMEFCPYKIIHIFPEREKTEKIKIYLIHISKIRGHLLG